MVQSIKDYGVLNPVIVRKAARGYEMLAGHNRTNAARIAGLTEVPAIVKTDLSDEDAYVYVIETNLLQRSFAELLPSEKAAVLVARYEKISSQGKRNDIRQEIEALEETCGHDVHKSRKRTCGHDVHKSQKSRDGLGEEYGMTGRNIARYMRLDRLIQKIQLTESAEADPYVSLVKRLAVDDKLDFDTAKLLITEYRRTKEET